MILTVNVDKFIKENKLKGPIISPQVYFRKTRNYHPVGLYSEEIFGLEGSLDRRKTFSWIELNCNVIHPVIYDILSKRIFRKIDKLLSNEVAFNIDENGYLVEVDEEEEENAEIRGMSDLVDNIKRIKFVDNDEEGDRTKIINMLYSNVRNGTFFTSKLIIISPDFRPVTETPETGEIKVDELSKLYQKIIMLSGHLKGVSGDLYDILTYRMQLLIRDLFEMIKVKVAKKSGIIRNEMLGRRVDYSGRMVITPDPTLSAGFVSIPLRSVCGLFEPYMLFGLTSNKSGYKVPPGFNAAVRQFLDKEETLSDIF